MSIQSMTGYARAQGRHGDCSWVWEAKSVNARGLDLRCRLPAGFDRLEPQARERATARFQRGNVTLGLSLTWERSAARYRISDDVLQEIDAALPRLRARFPEAAPPTIDGLLGLRGVIEAVETPLPTEAEEALDAAILASLEAALDALAETRRAEGARLAETLAGHLTRIGDLCTEAGNLDAVQPDNIRRRLQTQVEELLAQVPALPEERLAQEAALLMTKADTREELDRLAGHCAAAGELLATGGAIGRRLDFLCQELNREANTLCAKAQDMALNRVGLDLKATVDQLREQVQNVE